MTDQDSKPEEWRRHPSYGGLYYVSDRGRVKGFHKMRHGRILKGVFHVAGYPMVCLSWAENGRALQKTICVHRLVVECFIGPIPDGMTVNHINAVKTDNRPENLEIATRREQVDHEVKMGLCPKGEGHGMAVLNQGTVLSIRHSYRPSGRGTGHRVLAKTFGISKTQVGRILRHESWKHL